MSTRSLLVQCRQCELLCNCSVKYAAKSFSRNSIREIVQTQCTTDVPEPSHCKCKIARSTIEANKTTVQLLGSSGLVSVRTAFICLSVSSACGDRNCTDFDQSSSFGWNKNVYRIYQYLHSRILSSIAIPWCVCSEENLCISTDVTAVHTCSTRRIQGKTHLSIPPAHVCIKQILRGCEDQKLL